jgi:hypothetical protein
MGVRYIEVARVVGRCFIEIAHVEGERKCFVVHLVYLVGAGNKVLSIGVWVLLVVNIVSDKPC